MKRLIILLLCVVLIFAFTSCSKPETMQDDSAAANDNEAPTETTEEPTPEPTEAPAPEPTPEPEPEVTEAPPEEAESTEFTVFNPFIEELSDELLAEMGADNFAGTDTEIANQILAWQGEHMHYIGNPMQQADIAHPMRWNYYLPGIFPVSEMVKERTTPDGKIYGLCWDYAAIYCTIATAYGLETRVTAVKELMSQTNPNIDPSTANGLPKDEYDLLNIKMTAKGLDLSFNQITMVAKETWAHYNAEVLLDGQWVTMDGSGGFAGNLEEVAWDEGYDPDTMYAENTELAQLDIICELLMDAPMAGYAGITDDDGNPNRAATMDDLRAGKGLAPYFDDVQDAIDFAGSKDDELYDDLTQIKMMYEMSTGQPFFAVADIIIYSTVEEIDAESYAAYYEALTGFEMPMMAAEMITGL